MAVAEQYDFRIGRVLGQTFDVLMRNIVPFGILALLFAVPTTFYNLAIADSNSAEQGVNDAIAGILGFLLQYSVMATLVYGTIQHLRGHGSSMGEIFGRGLALVPPVLGVAIVQTVAIWLMTLAGVFVAQLLGVDWLAALLIIPLVFLIIIWWVAVPVAAIERPGVFASLGRSARLTEGNRWRLFGLLLILVLLAVVAVLIVTFVFGVLFSGVGGFVFSWIGTALFYAISAVLVAVSYYELRAAKEGVDIEEVASVFD